MVEYHIDQEEGIADMMIHYALYVRTANSDSAKSIINHYKENYEQIVPDNIRKIIKGINEERKSKLMSFIEE